MMFFLSFIGKSVCQTTTEIPIPDPEYVGICDCGNGSELIIGSGVGDPFLSLSPNINPDEVFTGTVRICGYFFVDVDWNIEGAEILMEKDKGAGGSSAIIFILPGINLPTLTVNETFIHACGNDMWRSIEVGTGCSLKATNNIIHDGKASISCQKQSFLTAIGNTFDKYDVGLNIDDPSPSTGLTSINLLAPLKGNNFMGTSTIEDNIPNNGILFRDNLTIDRNNFDGPVNGVFSKPGGALNMTAGSYFKNSAGTGETGFGVYGINNSLIDIAFCDFENIERGVFLEWSNANIEINLFNDVYDAIVVNDAAGGFVKVKDHSEGAINVHRVGIETVGLNISDLEISNNEVTIDDEISDQITKGIRVSSNFFGKPAVVKSCKVNNYSKRCEAIDVSSFVLDVRLCDSKNFNSESEIWTGLKLQGSQECNILYNELTDMSISSSTGAVGLLSEGSEVNLFRCNITKNAYTGIRVKGFSGFSSFRQNIIGEHFNGLLFEEFVVTGIQDQHFNQWQPGTYLNAGAEHLSSNQFLVSLSRFVVRDPVPPLFPDPVVTKINPATNQPITWFEVQATNGEPIACNEIEPGGGTGGDTGLLGAIARNEFYQEETEEALEYTSERFLYKKLDSNSELLNSDPEFLNFYFENQNSNIGKFHDVELAIEALNAAPEGQSEYNDLIESIHNGNLEIKSHSELYDELTSEDLPEWEDSFIQMQNDLRVVVAEANQMYKTLFPIDFDKINQILSDNSGIQPVGEHQIYEQILNQIWLNTVAQRNINFNEEQLNTLQSIANQCPSTKGNVVYRARNMLQLINSNQSFEDNCEEGQFRISNPGNLTSNFKTHNLFPNPATDFINIKFDNADSERIVKLTDLTGKVLQVWESKNEDSKYISLKSFEPGCYLVSIVGNGILSTTEKLIIQ